MNNGINPDNGIRINKIQANQPAPTEQQSVQQNYKSYNGVYYDPNEYIGRSMVKPHSAAPKESQISFGKIKKNDPQYVQKVKALIDKISEIMQERNISDITVNPDGEIFLKNLNGIKSFIKNVPYLAENLDEKTIINLEVTQHLLTNTNYDDNDIEIVLKHTNEDNAQEVVEKFADYKTTVNSLEGLRPRNKFMLLSFFENIDIKNYDEFKQVVLSGKYNNQNHFAALEIISNHTTTPGIKKTQELIDAIIPKVNFIESDFGNFIDKFNFETSETEDYMLGILKDENIGYQSAQSIINNYEYFWNNELEDESIRTPEKKLELFKSILENPRCPKEDTYEIIMAANFDDSEKAKPENNNIKLIESLFQNPKIKDGRQVGDIARNFNDSDIEYINYITKQLIPLRADYYKNLRPYLEMVDNEPEETQLKKREMFEKLINSLDYTIKDRFFFEVALGSILSKMQDKPEIAESIIGLTENSIELDDNFLDIFNKAPADFAQNLQNTLENLKNEYNSKSFKIKSSSDTESTIEIVDNMGHIFNVNKNTGKLARTVINNTVINPELDTKITSTQTNKKDDLLKALGTDSEVPNFIEIAINKQTGEMISTETMKDSAIAGEYEIYQTYPDGTKSLVGLAEYDANGCKHIEKTLLALDGSKTDYVYADDKDGNRFLHYKITDKDGNITFQTEKSFKVLSENHFQTSKNGQHYDIEIKDDKIITTKLDANKEKTSETVEYKIVDFSDEDYKKIYENFLFDEDSDILDKLKTHGHNLVDKKLLTLLKQLSGDEWFALDKNTHYIIENCPVPVNASAHKGFITVSKEVNENNLLAAVEHEIGHEKFAHYDFEHDTELQKIYSEERTNFINSFPKQNVESISYFLEDNETNWRGLNETSAETNQIINISQTFNAIKDRTIILQQFFPKTIAYIANKYENY